MGGGAATLNFPMILHLAAKYKKYFISPISLFEWHLCLLVRNKLNKLLDVFKFLSGFFINCGTQAHLGLSVHHDFVSCTTRECMLRCPQENYGNLMPKSMIALI